MTYLSKKKIPEKYMSDTGDIYINRIGKTIPKGYLTSAKGDEYTLVNIADETSIENIVGIATMAIQNRMGGPGCLEGSIRNIENLGLKPGRVYINKNGGLTNIKPCLTIPEYCVNDYVITVGIIIEVENRQDLLVSIKILGQLK